MVPQSRLILYAGLLCFALVGLVASFFYEAEVERTRVQMYAPEPVLPEPEFAEMYPVTLDNFSGVVSRFDADQWIRSVWRACNTGELTADPRWSPPPPTPHGQMYMAACHALAGDADQSRAIIDALPATNRTEASGILSTAMFPAARQGRYDVVGPAMELVLEHWPTMAEAMFYAAMGRLAVEDFDAAHEHLESYVAAATNGTGTLQVQRRDKALELIARIDAAKAKDASRAP